MALKVLLSMPILLFGGVVFCKTSNSNVTIFTFSKMDRSTIIIIIIPPNKISFYKHHHVPSQQLTFLQVCSKSRFPAFLRKEPCCRQIISLLWFLGDFAFSKAYILMSQSTRRRWTRALQPQGPSTCSKTSAFCSMSQLLESSESIRYIT